MFSTYILLNILYSNAFCIWKDLNIFFSKCANLTLVSACFTCFTTLLFIPLEKDIILYGGSLCIISIEHSFTIFILLITTITLVYNSLYYRTLIPNKIVKSTFKLLGLILYDYYTTTYNLMLKAITLTSYTVTFLITKFVPISLILYSSYEYTSCNILHESLGSKLSCLLGFAFILSNIFIIYLVLTNRNRSIKLLRSFINLITQPNLLLQLFILLVFMFILRNIILDSSVNMNNRSIIIIFYVVISLLPVPPFYFTIIALMKNGKIVSVCDYHKLYYNSCKSSIQGSTILYIFISIVFVRLIFIPLFYTFTFYEVAISFLASATWGASVFMENYNHEVGDFGLSQGLSEFNSASPNPSPNPGNQDLLLASSNNNSSKNESDQDSTELNPSTQKICSGSLEKDVLEEIKHDKTTDYCASAWLKIKNRVVNLNLTPLKLAKQMSAENVTCYDIFSPISLQGGYVTTKVNPLNLSQPNPNLDVYNLANKLARLVSLEVITRTPNIKISNNYFVRLTDINYNVSFEQIKNNLTDTEKYLLSECIKTNKGYYRGINIKQDVIANEACFLSNTAGFNVINTLNGKGLFNYFSQSSLRVKNLKPSTNVYYSSNHIKDKLKFTNEGLSGSKLIDPTKQKVNSKLDFIVDNSDLSLVADSHNHSEKFCEKGLYVINNNSKDRPYSTFLEKLGKTNITCGNLFQPLPCENGLVQVFHNKLNLDNPNIRNDVYQLAKKMAILTSNHILSKPGKMVFTRGSFSKMIPPNRTVFYSDISQHFSLQEKNLFYTCVFTNPTHYSTITLDKANLSIKSESKIMTGIVGYKVMNALNQLGISKHYCYGKMTRELHKLRQNEVSDSVQAESSTSNKRKLSDTDFDSSTTSKKKK